MNIIIDYGRGNLKSLKNALDRIGFDSRVSGDIEEIRNASSVIIPGVGAFADAMQAMEEAGLTEVIKEVASSGKHILGICLGMQLLYEKGYEYGEHRGLGILKGSVRYLDIDEKVPHMGWNKLKFNQKQDPILKNIKEDDYVYFVHSYYADTDAEEVVAYADYGKKVPAIVRSGNIYGIQFHPEKSGAVGEEILKAYKDIVDNIKEKK